MKTKTFVGSVKLQTRFSSFAEQNAFNQKYWKVRMRRTDELLEQEDLLECATRRLAEQRFVPVGYQQTFDRMLELAEADRKDFRISLARTARSSVRDVDLLNDFIYEIVDVDPKITLGELVRRIRRTDRKSDFCISNGVIAWTKSDGTEGSALESGLEDRLSRTKQRLKKQSRSHE